MRTNHWQRVLLIAGLVLFGLGILNVVRNSREVDADAKLADAQRAKYTGIIQDAAKRPPRFDVSLVQFRLADIDALTNPSSGLRYDVVPDGIGETVPETEGEYWMGALLVTTPSLVPKVRLEAERREASGSVIVDLQTLSTTGRRAGSTAIEWTPSANVGALVPLCLLRNRRDGFMRVVSKLVLAPKGLVARTGDGRKVRIDIEGESASYGVILQPGGA